MIDAKGGQSGENDITNGFVGWKEGFGDVLIESENYECGAISERRRA